MQREDGRQGSNAVTVVGNCHCLPLADALALCTSGVVSDYIDLNFAQTPEMVAKIEALDTATSPLVFTQPISEAHGPLATERLRARLGADRVLVYTNIYFTGLQPDITYVGGFGSRVESFLGPYHSKLALFGFVTKRSVSDCVDFFSGPVYEKVGYMAAFEQSATELRSREAACDIRFAETFLDMARLMPVLLSVNHPTASVFLELAAAMATYAGLTHRPFKAPFFLNHLASSYIWPVYDPIAEHLGLAYRTPQLFVNVAGRGSRTSTVQEFVAGCYASYEAADFAELAGIVNQSPFFLEFAAKLGV